MSSSFISTSRAGFLLSWKSSWLLAHCLRSFSSEIGEFGALVADSVLFVPSNCRAQGVDSMYLLQTCSEPVLDNKRPVRRLNLQGYP